MQRTIQWYTLLFHNLSKSCSFSLLLTINTTVSLLLMYIAMKMKCIFCIFAILYGPKVCFFFFLSVSNKTKQMNTFIQCRFSSKRYANFYWLFNEWTTTVLVICKILADMHRNCHISFLNGDFDSESMLLLLFSKSFHFQF